MRSIAISSFDFADIFDQLHLLVDGLHDVRADMVLSALDAIWSHLSKRATKLKESDMAKTLTSGPTLVEPR